jgi:hypothetical protein
VCVVFSRAELSANLLLFALTVENAGGWLVRVRLICPP